MHHPRHPILSNPRMRLRAPLGDLPRLRAPRFCWNHGLSTHTQLRTCTHNTTTTCKNYYHARSPLPQIPARELYATILALAAWPIAINPLRPLGAAITLHLTLTAGSHLIFLPNSTYIPYGHRILWSAVQDRIVVILTKCP